MFIKFLLLVFVGFPLALAALVLTVASRILGAISDGLTGVAESIMEACE